MAEPVMTVRVFPDPVSLSRAAAAAVARVAGASIRRWGSFSVALSGGRTPRGAYVALAREYSETLDWGSVHIFFGDERLVSRQDPASNYGMAKGSLLSRVPIPPANVHPVPTGGSAEDVARMYEGTIRACLDSLGPAGRGLDLVLLGLGADGHTASLFPGDTLLGRDRRWVRSVQAPAGYDIRRRITLSLEAIRHAERALFIVSGREKRDALEAVVSGGGTLPAARVRCRSAVEWFVDRDALGGSFPP